MKHRAPPALIFVLTVVTLGQCLEPVTLFMPPSCPEDPTSRPTFTCLTLGSDLGWSITTDHNSYDFYFNSLDVVGASRLEDGFEAVLLGISNSTTRTKKLRMSALTIGDSVPHGLLTIECTNIVTSTITVQYQHSLAALPPPPEITNRSVIMADMSGTTFIVLNISWTALPDIDHYEVHIDQHPATLVMNTTIITMCESSLEENHTVHLTAVNTCGRQSSTTLSDIRLMNYVTTESIASSRDYNNGGHSSFNGQLLTVIFSFLLSCLKFTV